MRGIQRVLAGAAALAVIFASSLASAEFPKPTYDHHAKAKTAQPAPKPAAHKAQAKPTATTRTKAKPAQQKAKPAAKSKPAAPKKK